jgi:organic radical activating enzyme
MVEGIMHKNGSPQLPGQAGQPLPIEIGPRLESLGLVYPVSGGIQIDVTAVKELTREEGFKESSFCDHNCRLTTDEQPTGGYECPAAFTSHRGLKITDMTPAPMLVEGIKKAAEGIRLANHYLRTGGWLEAYFENSDIPTAAQTIIDKALASPIVEVNLYGGNPELHPEISEIIANLEDGDLSINLTTTGFRFMQNTAFLEDTLAHPPDLVAVSADEFDSIREAERITSLSMAELKKERFRVPWREGQRRKCLEAVYVAKLAEADRRFPKVLLNVVVHPGNLDFIEPLIELLHRVFPGALVNPFPAQTPPSELGPDKNEWGVEQLQALEEFLNRRITEHLEQRQGIVRRLQYYLMLKAACMTVRKEPEKLAAMLSGNGVWNCFRAPGAGRYVKIGASPLLCQKAQHAGGHLACFWNQVAVTARGQIWMMTPQAIAHYIISDMQKLARHPEGVACTGCVMPRLSFDMVSLESGMNPDLMPAYLELRKTYVGF